MGLSTKKKKNFQISTQALFRFQARSDNKTHVKSFGFILCAFFKTKTVFFKHFENKSSFLNFLFSCLKQQNTKRLVFWETIDWEALKLLQVPSTRFRNYWELNRKQVGKRETRTGLTTARDKVNAHKDLIIVNYKETCYNSSRHWTEIKIGRSRNNER